ncbi:Uncharacterized protein PBTT_03114 [Plasmodiophora brassicae]
MQGNSGGADRTRQFVSSTLRSTPLPRTPLPKPVSPKSKSPAFAATVGAKARERIRGLLGRPRSYNDGDPPASLFSVQGHANFFATFDETTLVDSPMLCL